MAFNLMNSAYRNTTRVCNDFSKDNVSPQLVLKSNPDRDSFSIVKTCNRVLKGDKSLASTIQSQLDLVKLELQKFSIPGSFHKNPNFFLGAIENSIVNTFSSYSYSTPTSSYSNKVGVDCFYVDEIKKNVAVFYLFSGISDFSKISEISSKPSISLPGRKKNVTLNKEIRSDLESSNGSSVDDQENTESNKNNIKYQTSRDNQVKWVAQDTDPMKFPQNPLTARKKNQSYTTPIILNMAASKEEKDLTKNCEELDESTNTHTGANNILSKLKQRQAKPNKHVILNVPEVITKSEVVAPSDKQVTDRGSKSMSCKNVIGNSNPELSKNSINHSKEEIPETFAEYADYCYLKILKKKFKSSISPNTTLIESVTSTLNSYFESLSSKKLSSLQRERLHKECEVSIVMIVDEYAWIATKGNCRVIASFKDGQEICRLSSVLSKNKVNESSYIKNNYVQESNSSTVEINLFRLPPDIDFICFLSSDILNSIMNREMVSNVFQALLKELESTNISSLTEINNSSVLYKAMRLIFNQHLKEYNIDNIAYAIMLFNNFTMNIDKEKISNIKSIMNRLNLSTPFYDNNDIYPLVLNNNNIHFEYSDKKRIKKVELNSSDYSTSVVSRNHFKIIYKTICLCFKRKEKHVVSESNNLNSSSFVKVSNQKLYY